MDLIIETPQPSPTPLEKWRQVSIPIKTWPASVKDTWKDNNVFTFPQLDDSSGGFPWIYTGLLPLWAP